MNTARNAAFVVLTQVSKLLLSVVALSTLSRILSPAEFGLFAMVTAVVGIGDLFRDFGLSMAAIQAPSLSRPQQSNLFWLNLAIGAALSAAAVGLAGPVAALYGRPELASAVAAVSLSFLLGGATAQFRVGLIRAGRFSSLTVADVVSQTIALAAAIALALAGAGFWALVAQVLVQASTSLLLVALQLRWLPGLPNREGRIRSMLGFGANLLGVQVLTYVGKNLDNILLGRFWGPVQLGFYAKAFTLYSQPLQQALAPFTDLAVNTLSRSFDDPEAYRARVRSMQLVSNYVALTLFGALIALATPVVNVVLGPGWSETAVLLQILGIGGLFQVLGNVYYWIFLTEGLTRLHLRLNLITQPIAVGLIVAGLPFGARGVAWGVTAGLVLEWLVPATAGAARSSLSATALLRNTLRPLVFGAGLALAAHLASLLAGPEASLLALVLGSTGALTWTAACLAVSRAIRGDLMRIAGFARSAVHRRSTRRTTAAPVAA